VGGTSIHRYLEALGLTLKKDAPCRRARSPGCRRGARGVARGPVATEFSLGLHLRDSDQDQHGPDLWSCPARPPGDRRRTARPLAKQHLRGRPAVRRRHCPLRDRRPDQRADVPGLCRAVPRLHLAVGDVVIMDKLGFYKASPCAPPSSAARACSRTGCPGFECREAPNGEVVRAEATLIWPI
jgi:hypothetical protein